MKLKDAQEGQLVSSKYSDEIGEILWVYPEYKTAMVMYPSGRSQEPLRDLTHIIKKKRLFKINTNQLKSILKAINQKSKGLKSSEMLEIIEEDTEGSLILLLLNGKFKTDEEYYNEIGDYTRWTDQDILDNLKYYKNLIERIKKIK